MAKFRKKLVVVEAITFDELVAHGREQTGQRSGQPWSFDYNGHPVTHETDTVYLIPTLGATMHFRQGDMLVTGVTGEICPMAMDTFEATYEPVEPSAPVQITITGARRGTNLDQLDAASERIAELEANRLGYPESFARGLCSHDVPFTHYCPQCFKDGS